MLVIFVHDLLDEVLILNFLMNFKSQLFPQIVVIQIAKKDTHQLRQRQGQCAHMCSHIDGNISGLKKQSLRSQALHGTQSKL